MYRFIK